MAACIEACRFPVRRDLSILWPTPKGQAPAHTRQSALKSFHNHANWQLPLAPQEPCTSTCQPNQTNLIRKITQSAILVSLTSFRDLVSARCSSPLEKYLEPQIFMAKPRSQMQQLKSGLTRMLRVLRSLWPTHGLLLSPSAEISF